MREAACQLAQWREDIAPAFKLSVNVSPVQLNSSGHCVQAWVAHLQDLSLPGSALVAEITERVLLEADKDTDARLQTLQSAGIQLALDDFGTGYSSLSYLKRFDIDYIKIDRCFVSLLSQGNEDATLCQAIIAMAHQLGICVVAEGVETREQHDILLRAGCDYGQGYWYGRPMPAQELTERLRASTRAAASSGRAWMKPSASTACTGRHYSHRSRAPRGSPRARGLGIVARIAHHKRTEAAALSSAAAAVGLLARERTHGRRSPPAPWRAAADARRPWACWSGRPGPGPRAAPAGPLPRRGRGWRTAR
ncbi:diguanylate cyclase [Alicycliphilus sp. B1]|nr:diguanylate cyclase [Alicycliphilus sp. B1]